MGVQVESAERLRSSRRGRRLGRVQGGGWQRSIYVVGGVSSDHPKPLALEGVDWLLQIQQTPMPKEVQAPALLLDVARGGSNDKGR
ncbi:hypothetical protein Q3G72_033787 [Acer saccharum]|nr:hypothetical protein Q3G72_033787 [Acer saccharum]